MKAPTMTMPYAFEPETAAFVQRQDAERAAALGNPTIEQLRDSYRAGFLSTSVPPDTSVRAEDLTITGATDALGARLYRPASSRTRGLLVYAHGGGFAVGDIDSHDALVRLISNASGTPVLTFHYRRAPEHPWPAARDDTAAVFLAAHQLAVAWGIDQHRIALGGESAGATHAVAATLHLRDTGGPLPHALWVMVPALDASGTGESHRLFAQGAGRSAAEFQSLWALYRPPAVAPDHPGLSPLYADLRGLPPTRVFVAEFDPARSDGEEFVARARIVGVDARVSREDGLIHQYPEITGVSPGSRDAVIRAAHALEAMLI